MSRSSLRPSLRERYAVQRCCIACHCQSTARPWISRLCARIAAPHKKPEGWHHDTEDAETKTTDQTTSSSDSSTSDLTSVYFFWRRHFLGAECVDKTLPTRPSRPLISCSVPNLTFWLCRTVPCRVCLSHQCLVSMPNLAMKDLFCTLSQSYGSHETSDVVTERYHYTHKETPIQPVRSITSRTLNTGKGLTVSSPASSVSCRGESATHYKCHSWRIWALPSSSTCSGFHLE